MAECDSKLLGYYHARTAVWIGQSPLISCNGRVLYLGGIADAHSLLLRHLLRHQATQLNTIITRQGYVLPNLIRHHILLYVGILRIISVVLYCCGQKKFCNLGTRLLCLRIKNMISCRLGRGIRSSCPSSHRPLLGNPIWFSVGVWYIPDNMPVGGLLDDFRSQSTRAPSPSWVFLPVPVRDCLSR